MSTGAKVAWTIVTLFLGAVLFGVVKASFGRGQFLLTAAEVYLLFLIWKQRAPTETASPLVLGPSADRRQVPPEDGALREEPMGPGVRVEPPPESAPATTEWPHQPQIEQPSVPEPPERAPSIRLPGEAPPGELGASRDQWGSPSLVVAFLVIFAAVVTGVVMRGPFSKAIGRYGVQAPNDIRFSVGDWVVLSSTTHSWVLGAASHQDYDELVKAGVSQDAEAARRLMASGKMIYIPNGTEALVREVSRGRLTVEYWNTDSHRKQKAVVLPIYTHEFKPTPNSAEPTNVATRKKPEVLSNQEVLSTAVKAVSEALPITVDGSTILFGVDCATDRIIYRYHVRLPQGAAPPTEAARRSLERRITAKACAEPKMALFWKRGISARYQYLSEDGKLIADFIVLPSDCGY